jgi:hypothetical protein
MIDRRAPIAFVLPVRDMRTHLLSGVLLVVLVAFGAGCSDAEVGEECGESGVEAGECVEGAICGKHDATDELYCLKVCTDQADCLATEDCNGVEGSSVKGCRLKP